MISLTHPITTVAKMVQNTAPEQAKEPVAVQRVIKAIISNRPDWRENRYASARYASSRVSYVEQKMTDSQAREFD